MLLIGIDIGGTKCAVSLGCSKDFLVTARGLLTPQIRSDLRIFKAFNSPSTVASQPHKNDWMH